MEATLEMRLTFLHQKYPPVIYSLIGKSGVFLQDFQIRLELIVSASCGLMLSGISFGWTAQVGVQLRDPLHPDYGLGISRFTPGLDQR